MHEHVTQAFSCLTRESCHRESLYPCMYVLLHAGNPVTARVKKKRGTNRRCGKCSLSSQGNEQQDQRTVRREKRMAAAEASIT